MSTETTTPPHATGYLLLFRNTQWDRDGYSEDQIRQAMEQTRAWFDRLGASGKLVSAQPLFEDCRHHFRQGRTQRDGRAVCRSQGSDRGIRAALRREHGGSRGHRSREPDARLRSGDRSAGDGEFLPDAVPSEPANWPGRRPSRKRSRQHIEWLPGAAPVSSPL
jgi:hypothetical protein